MSHFFFPWLSFKYSYSFKEKYEYPILRGNEKKASDREKRIGSAVAKVLYSFLAVCLVYFYVGVSPLDDLPSTCQRVTNWASLSQMSQNKSWEYWLD